MPTMTSPNAQFPTAPPRFPMKDSDQGIGLALGSPTTAPASGQDPSMVPRTMTTITSPAAAATEQQEQQQQQQQHSKSTGLSRQISKRLPFLGRSKSKRRNSNNGGTNYSRPCTDLRQTNYVTGSPAPPTPSPSTPHSSRTNQDRARPDAAKLKKQRFAATRSVTDPHAQSSTGGLLQKPAWKLGQPGPILDVEIPDIRLERYSVMFGSLFEKQQAAGGLLARRQATLARIRATEDDVRREHQAELLRARRATSPSMPPARSPVAELPGDSAAGINVVPLRLRSHTFPLVGRESSALSPQAPPPADQVDSPGTSLLSPNSQLSPGRDSEGRPRLHSKFHKPSVESISSPYFRQAAERENGTALSPPPGPGRRLADGGSGSNVASPAYMTTMPTAKQIDIPDRSTSLRNRSSKMPAAPKPNPKPTSREEELEDAAEVSIARQISISRGQRRFLEPLHERERRRARANQHIKAASQISLDDGKRIAETKTATPTLVHPDLPSGGGLARSPQQHMYRRSEQVTIEGA
ncbi:hypothetical protein V2A60_007453 [Cordyceps javanica]|uniref:Uncharacterized protein n=1 Tax=Cordyceps javanica TaxID=43265 RepID=A0A545W7T5_9HYPO|nr:hypothetical protein IF1G_02928 [Cordyceps javanica]TQW10060.1 hypothetical protein IF2G_02850 [Cordyceps javanica]